MSNWQQYIGKKVTFEDICPIWSIEDAQMIFKDGRVAIGYRITCVEMEKLSLGGYEKIGESFSQALKNLEENVVVQLLGYYHYVGYEASLKDKSFFESQIIGNFLERPVQLHDQFVFISFGLDADNKKSSYHNFFANGVKNLKNPFQFIQKVKNKVESIANTFVSGIAHADIRYQRLDDAALQEVALQYLNFDFKPKPTGLKGAYSKGIDGMSIGNKRIGIVSMTGQNTEIFYDRMNRLGVVAPFIEPLTNSLEIPHILSISIRINDSNQVKEKMEGFENSITDGIQEKFPILASESHIARKDAIQSFVHEVTTNANSIVSLNVSCIVSGLDKYELDEHLEKAQQAFSSMGSDSVIESLDTMSLFFSNIAGGSFQGFRWLDFISNANASAYGSFVTNVRSHTKGDLLCDRFGKPILVDMFDEKKLNNQNFILVGPTGSGKTFTVMYLILQRYERGERQIIIDIVGNYRNLFTCLKNSKYYEYDPENPLRYNPFLVEKNAFGLYVLEGTRGNKVEFLLNLLTTIWRGNEALNNTERSILSDFIYQYYAFVNETLENGSKIIPSIADFYAWLIDFKKKNAKKDWFKVIDRNIDVDRFLVTLKDFAVGIYKDILNSETIDDMTAYPLICFDLGRIKDNKTLYPIVGMIISELSFDIISKYQLDIKRLYIDEAWSMLKDLVGDFIEYWYRTIRRYFGGIGIITQGIIELKNSGIGEVLKANSATVIVLKHTDTKILKDLIDYMGFTEHEGNLAMSLRHDPNEIFREFFIKQGEFSRVLRIEVPPLIVSILSSRAADRIQLQEALASGVDIFGVVRRHSENKLREENLLLAS